MVNRTRTKICLGLVYYDKNRYKYIKPMLTSLRRSLSEKFDIELIEAGKQPEDKGFPMGIVLARKLYLWKLNRDWIKYKGLKPRNILIDFVILVRRLIITILNKDKESRRCVIDSYVTDKHIRLWSQFLDMDYDFLVCFEDDAIFKQDSIERIGSFLYGISKSKWKYIYLDLAGGLSPELLKVESLEYKREKGCKYYRKPVTNTACCYLVSKASASVFSYYLLRNPRLRLISIDWLLNKLFILSAPLHKYLCYHASPPIFSHGSLSGKYSSWL